MEGIKPPAEFVPYSNEKKWETWRESFEIFAIAVNLESMPLVRQRAILKHIAGEKTVMIYKTFHISENDTYLNVKEMLDMLTNHFKPFKNTIQRRNAFFTCVQKERQGIMEFVTELKHLAQECEFENLTESLIRDRLIIGILDREVKRKLLEDPQLTLPRAISIAVISESTCSQVALLNEQKMIEKIEKRNWVKDTIRMENAEAGPSGINPRRERIIEPCKWCGQRHKYGKCPAYGKKCNACGKTNHFSVVCRTKRIRNLLAESEAEESCDEINLNEVAVKTVRSDKWSAVIIINGKKTTVHLDTGAQINVLPHKVINQWPSRPEIRPTSLKAFAYGNTELPIVGKCNVLCQYGEKKGMFEFIVADVEAQTLITGDTCEKLEILRRINHINTDEMKLCSETQKILEQYHEVFQGVGLINSECKIYTKPEYSPVQVPPRRIPTSLGAEVQSELEKMVKQGIVTKIYHETEWSHPMVVVKKKSGQIRICLDPRKLNEALVGRHFQTPAPAELLHEIPKAKYYTVLDVKSAYWHIPVAKECRDLLCDASKDAMGAALLQEDRSLAFASASFSDSQKQYSQIEKELLSVYYGCKKFEYLLSGHTFVVQTDHHPLLPLVKKPLSDISPRLQRLVMKLIAFDFKLQYKPGKYLIVADTLSRDTHPMDELPTPFLEDKRMVKMVRVNISDEKLVAMQKDTREDPALVKVIDYVIEGWPICKKDVDEDAKVFFDFRHRLYLWNDLLCIGSAIVIPKTQRNNMLNLLHQLHQGISAIQGLARESLFWPRMSIDIAEKVKNCEICQKHQKSKIRQPLKPFPVPDYPWQTVSLDIFYIQKKPHLLVVDRYSGYPEVFTLDPPTASNVKNKLRETFARFGIPETMMSDNGPPFRSEIMTDFCIRWGIKQLFSSPHLHRSNGLAERNTLIKCRDERSDPYLAILAYRNTPKNDLPSPAQLCLSRSLRCQIPRITPLYRPYQTNWRSIENAKRKRQSSMKEQYDRNSKSYPKVNVGEDAWCQIHPRETWTPVKISAQADSPQSFEVVTPSGNRLIRNQQFIRPRDGGYEKGQLSSEPITASPEAQHPQCDSPTMGESSTAPIQRSSEETNIDQREGATTSAGIAPEPSGRPRFSRFGRELRKPQRFGNPAKVPKADNIAARPTQPSKRVTRDAGAQLKNSRQQQALSKVRSAAFDQFCYFEYCADFSPVQYIKAPDEILGKVFQLMKMSSQSLVGLETIDKAKRLSEEGLTIENTLLKVFPYTKHADKIVVGTLPIAIRDEDVVASLRPYCRVVSLTHEVVASGDTPGSPATGRPSSF
ncbi:K02A2.6-like [Cordylochernes scorpioides]|uniref:RNA-directed DNA polymerase n=1 Tax=Cordylochernes scorpioides TaxID=51811 RepID=A0ABY6L828_9ARAC|nr:K02A2.6-like [Cordylochernes scorpioides]